VEGSQIKDDLGNTVLLHGVNFPGFCDGAAGSEWGHLYREPDYIHARSWGINVIRLPFAQNFWDTGSYGGRTTKQLIDDQIMYAERNGMYIILDYHGQTPPMNLPTNWNSWLNTWVQIAQRYKSKSNVIFELLNEPRAPLTFQQWAGHAQDGVNAIRNAGADNLVLVGGWNWGNQLTPYINTRINGTNIVYTSHLYWWYTQSLPSTYNELKNTLSSSPYQWNYFVKNNIAPVLVGEFNIFNPFTASQTEINWYANMLTILNEWNMSYTPWAWIEPRGEFPLLQSDWVTPTLSGTMLISAINASAT
jgi:endoglucanase